MRENLVLIYVWGDGTWCFPEELCEMTHLSDFYMEKLVTVEEIEKSMEKAP